MFIINNSYTISFYQKNKNSYTIYTLAYVLMWTKEDFLLIYKTYNRKTFLIVKAYLSKITCLAAKHVFAVQKS